MAGEIEKRLKEHGIEIPSAPNAVGAYVPAVKTGTLVVTSGQLPLVGKELAFKGRVGDGLHESDGAAAARLCVLNALAQIQRELGSLENVARVVRLEGYVSSAPGFHNQPAILNGASELLVNVFGETGRHTRTAVGVSELPLDAPVKIALWVEAKE